MKKRIIFFAFFLVLFIVFPKIIVSCFLAWYFGKFVHEMYFIFQALKNKKLKKVKGVQ